MDKYTLNRETFLGGYQKSFGTTILTEIEDLDIYSMACSSNKYSKLKTEFKQKIGIDLPVTGTANGSISEGILIIGMAQDQWFMFSKTHTKKLLENIPATMGQCAYFTHQSDSWVALRLVGKLAIPALERICSIDLHPSVFMPGSAARTLMEHLGVVVYCEDINHYILLSASSSASSFLHALETSLRYVS